jgi:hypothetical protein
LPPFHRIQGRQSRPTRATLPAMSVVNDRRRPFIAVCPRSNMQAPSPAPCGHAEQKISVDLVIVTRAETVMEQLAMSNPRNNLVALLRVEGTGLRRRAGDDMPCPQRPAISAHAG